MEVAVDPNTRSDGGVPQSSEPIRRHDRRKPRILLGVTGSVAGVKGPELAVRLVDECRADVRVLLTKGGTNFWMKAREYNPGVWNRMTHILDQQTQQQQQQTHQQNNTTDDDDDDDHRPSLIIHDAEEEWGDWSRMGDPVLHIELRNWADAMVIAPLSAHTLAKIASGLCDDTLSCVARAWDYGQYGDAGGNGGGGKPLLLAPAMNTAMWLHPLTKQQLETIRRFATSTALPTTTAATDCLVRVIQPQAKVLACGELGDGALASIGDILASVRDAIATRCRISDDP